MKIRKREFLIGDNEQEGLFILTKKMEEIQKKDDFIFIGNSSLIDFKKDEFKYISTIYDKKNFDIFSGLNKEELSTLFSNAIDSSFHINKRIINMCFDIVNELKLAPIEIEKFKEIFVLSNLENLQSSLKEKNTKNAKKIINDIEYFTGKDLEFYSVYIDKIYSFLNELSILNLGLLLNNTPNQLLRKNKIYIHTKSYLLKSIIFDLLLIKKRKSYLIIENINRMSKMQKTMYKDINKIDFILNQHFLITSEYEDIFTILIKKEIFFKGKKTKIFYLGEKNEEIYK